MQAGMDWAIESYISGDSGPLSVSLGGVPSTSLQRHARYWRSPATTSSGLWCLLTAMPSTKARHSTAQ